MKTENEIREYQHELQFLHDSGSWISPTKGIYSYAIRLLDWVLE